MIHDQSGQPPEMSDTDGLVSNFRYNRNRSLYKLRKHRQHQDCEGIFNLLGNNEDNNNIVVLEPTGDPARHAEEQLTDHAIRLHKESFETGRRMTFQIRGKKRPCKACHGYMASRGIVGYNKKSGYLFIDALIRQLKNRQYEAVKYTLYMLLSKFCWVSASRSERGAVLNYPYDTDSDSDHEKYEERDNAEQSFVEYYERTKMTKVKQLVWKLKRKSRHTTARSKANTKSRDLRSNESRDRNMKPRDRNMKPRERIPRHRNMKSRERKAARMMKSLGLLMESDSWGC